MRRLSISRRRSIDGSRDLLQKFLHLDPSFVRLEAFYYDAVNFGTYFCFIFCPVVYSDNASHGADSCFSHAPSCAGENPGVSRIANFSSEARPAYSVDLCRSANRLSCRAEIFKQPPEAYNFKALQAQYRNSTCNIPMASVKIDLSSQRKCKTFVTLAEGPGKSILSEW